MDRDKIKTAGKTWHSSQRSLVKSLKLKQEELRSRAHHLRLFSQQKCGSIQKEGSTNDGRAFLIKKLPLAITA